MVTLPALLAHQFGGYFQIMPKEADGGFDPRFVAIGSGPWQLGEHVPSSRVVLKRHPDYFDKEHPFLDTLEQAIVPEYATGLAQFKAGSIYSFTVKPEDVLPTRNDVPALDMFQAPVASNVNAMYFGWRPTAKSPFRDARLRQAMSMTLDRDLIIDVNYDTERLQKEGFPVERRWNSALPANYFSGWWLDPKGKDFGENAKYFKRGVAEAKKLLSAAGYANGFETTSNYVTGPELGTTPKHAEVIDGFIRELGVKVNVKSLNYANEYIPKFRDGKGQYDGYTYVSTAGAPTGDEALIVLANEYWSKGTSAAFHGFSANGQNDQSGDPKLDEMFQKGRFERDNAKRAEIVRDIQRYIAKPWYAASLPGMGKVFTVAWPALRNFRVWQGRNARSNYQQWVDDTKAPLAKS